jgi:hypothetical protein
MSYRDTRSNLCSIYSGQVVPLTTAPTILGAGPVTGPVTGHPGTCTAAPPWRARLVTLVRPSRCRWSGWRRRSASDRIAARVPGRGACLRWVVPLLVPLLVPRAVPRAEFGPPGCRRIGSPGRCLSSSTSPSRPHRPAAFLLSTYSCCNLHNRMCRLQQPYVTSLPNCRVEPAVASAAAPGVPPSSLAQVPTASPLGGQTAGRAVNVKAVRLTAGDGALRPFCGRCPGSRPRGGSPIRWPPDPAIRARR